MPSNPLRQLVAKPTIAAIVEYYQPPLCQAPAPTCNPDKEVVVLATACFQGVDPRVYDTHRALVAQLAVDYGVNLWIIPVHERMPFPDAILFTLGAMMNMEVATGRKADWFFWVEDDVCVPKDIVRHFRANADPAKRPFIAAVAYDRNPPFMPAVWDWLPDGNLRQWTHEEVPQAGLHEVGAVGLTAALIHRSVFDRVEEPYFAAGSPMLTFGDKKNQIVKGIKPDGWWSIRLKQKGIPSYVHAGVLVTHLSARIPINRDTAIMFRDLPGFHFADFERTMRGQLAQGMDTRNGGSVPPGVRQGGPQGLDGGHDGGGGAGPTPTPGEHGDLGLPQAAPTPCPELPGAVRVEQSPSLWRDWNPAG